MQIRCTQCGGAVEVQPGLIFITCSYCSSALYLDKSAVVFHYVITPTITLEEAQGKLRRWMAGNETVKDLDAKAVITGQELIYFPMWRFVATASGGDEEFSEPASSFAIADIKSIPLSGGDLKFFAPKEFEGIPLKEPDVLLESARSWLQQDKGLAADRIKETNLIHIPFYIFKYEFGGQKYQAVVDAASGRVLTSVYPAKAELPFIGIALLSAFILFVEGLIVPSFLLRFIVYVITIVPLGFFCYGIVKKY